MNRIAVVLVFVSTFLTSIPLSAQWSWEGQVYFGLNQNLFLPVEFNGNVDVTVEQGFTVTAPYGVTGNGHTMTKRGGGRFWFQVDNPLFDSDIVYAGKSDTVRLDGIFGAFVNDSIGYLYTGSLISSVDSTSLFHLHQNDTVVQTFDAGGYNHTNTNLYLYSDTRSTLRIVKSSDRLAGKVHLPNGGTLYIDGTYNAKVRVEGGGRFITGENSAVQPVHKDYATFANLLSNDTAIIISASTVQVGMYDGPSLVNVTSGDVVMKNASVLEIDVYDPNINRNLTAVTPAWAGSFSDKIYLGTGDFVFDGPTRINATWDSAYIASITADTFYLPVIMLNNPATQYITGANHVTVTQNLPTWYIGFVLGDGTNGTQSGWGYLRGIRILPDNISDADCFIEPASTTWSIRELLPINTTALIHNYGPLTAGDIDGDDTVEIIAFSNEVANETVTTSYPSKGIKIFTVKNGAVTLKHSFNFVNANETPGGVSTWSSMAIARYNNEGYIVLMGQNRRLYAYRPDGTLAWQNLTDYVTELSEPYDVSTMINITDFNGDGIPEIYTGNKVFDLRNGNLLCKGISTDNVGVLNRGYATIAADIDGDGLPEICAGTQIYKVHIDPVTPANSSITVMNDWTLPTAVLPAHAYKDGATQIADIDNDGNLEIVVLSRILGTTGHIVAYVWKPQPDNGSFLMGSYDISIAGINHYSIPMIGNIDDSPYPEIVFITDGNYNSANQYIYALKYDPAQPAGNRLGLKWRMPHTDESGSTGMSLFDFNLDGVNEIVYRGQTQLRIIDGDQTTTPLTLETFNNVTSGTLREFPLIADIDGDGQAEIVVAGHTLYQNESGYLRVFKSNGFPWAPARKVWNQYAYNAVNVNDDLTVPRYQINPATAFPGVDGIWGNGDDVRPFNNFMQQQTILSKSGKPLWLAPDARPDDPVTFTCNATGDSLRIVFTVFNAGEAALQAPLYVSAYKNAVTTPNRLATDSIMTVINAGDSQSAAIVIRNFSAILSQADSILVRLNDRGQALIIQPECDTTNNIFTRKVSAILRAHNDRAIAVSGLPTLVPVLKNDSVPAGCTPTTVVTTNPPHGNASVVNDSIRYTSVAGYSGNDTLTYRIICGADTSFAEVYIYIAKQPDNLLDGCSIDPPTMIWDMERKAVSNAAVHPLATPFAGDLDGDGHVEVVTPDAVGYTLTASAILIFDDSLQLKHTITPPVPMPNYGVMTFLIADVDNDGMGEIVVADTNRYLRCYAHDGVGTSPKWVTAVPYTTKGDGKDCPSLIVADINGDGHAEILATDKIYDGATGALLVSLPAGGRGYAAGGPQNASMPVFADIDNDGIQEVVAGNTVYKITINSRTSAALNTAEILATAPNGLPDGFTSVADIDLDGDLDVIVTGVIGAAGFYVWDGGTSVQIGQSVTFSGARISRPFAGDITGDGRPDIAFTYTSNMAAYSYNPVSRQFDPPLWQKPTSDASGATTMTMFDFDQDGEVELVYRDMTDLRIIGKDGENKATFPCSSATHTEYPIIVDLDRDGHADILVSGGTAGYSGTRLIRYGSITPNQWASARSVWNQHAYNSSNINDDLSVPAHPVNPATVFPGDVRPFNNFLQQQTPLSNKGTAFWIGPDAYPEPSLTVGTVVGDSVSITVGIINQGDATVGSPVYVTLYRDTVRADKIIKTDSALLQILPGDTGYVTVNVAHITPFLPIFNIIIRINDDGTATFPHQPECDNTNNEMLLYNLDIINLMMKKRATLNGVQHNGTYPNPVSVLYGDTIKYEITAVNASYSKGPVIIKDTLPPYLQHVSGTASIDRGTYLSILTGSTAGTPSQDTITWMVSNVDPLDSVVVSVEAMPVGGAVASQPLFINKAWVRIDTILAHTNSVYHQGAGVSVVTFSASAGGRLYNAEPQALDYRTSPRAGVLILPDDGYEFAGWSHDEYISLKGEKMKAASGIMHYDDIVIYGDVELRANFVPARKKPFEKIIIEEPLEKNRDNVWSKDRDLYIRAPRGTVARIYTTEGVLQRELTVTDDGTTTVRLERGFYVVTLNGGAGYKVRIE